MVKNVAELVRLMKPLMHQWNKQVELLNKKGEKRRNNDGDPGNTLEALLGVPENNLSLPDFGSIEIKTQKYEGDSLLTLFHKDPMPRACVPKLIKCLGWRHGKAGIEHSEDEMSFRSTTFGHRFSDRGLKIEIIGDEIRFLYNPSEVNRDCSDKTGNFLNYGAWADNIEQRVQNYRDVFPIYYKLPDVLDKFKEKLDYTLLVLYKTKIKDGCKYHWYEESYLMKGMNLDIIPKLIKEGSIAVDFDARTGHNHGTKFRIKKDQLRRLFTHIEIM